MRMLGISAALLLAATVTACSPPKSQTLAQCKATASSQARGRSLDPSDIGELTEACMLNKGYALKEGSSRCPDNAATPNSMECYYPNTFTGRLLARFSSG